MFRHTDSFAEKLRAEVSREDANHRNHSSDVGEPGLLRNTWKVPNGNRASGRVGEDASAANV